MANDAVSWRKTRLRDSDDTLRWRLLVELPSLFLGLDERGRWVRFLPATDQLIALTPGNELFLLPLLDTDYAEVSRALSIVTAGDGSCPAWPSLIQRLLAFALRQRTPSYIGSALRWLAQLDPDGDTCDALRALSQSDRGTQQQRQMAFALLRRHPTMP